MMVLLMVMMNDDNGVVDDGVVDDGVVDDGVFDGM